MTTDDFPTTRRFARTLAEAFADERAPAIEVGPRPWWWRVVRALRALRRRLTPKT